MFWQKKQEPKQEPNAEPIVIGTWFVAQFDPSETGDRPWTVFSLLRDADSLARWKEFYTANREDAEAMVKALDRVQDAMSSKEAAHVSE